MLKYLSLHMDVATFSGKNEEVSGEIQIMIKVEKGDPSSQSMSLLLVPFRYRCSASSLQHNALVKLMCRTVA
jgi:hypothetical protein